MYLSKLCLHYRIFKLTDNDCGKIKSSILCLKTGEISFFEKKERCSQINEKSLKTENIFILHSWLTSVHHT